MNKARRQIIESHEISEVCEMMLGGYIQKIMLDGKRKSNPIVICLHGGPGTPIPFNIGCRGLFPEITECVTLVCWDQLGCGINNQVINDAFQINDFVGMTKDLISEIRHRFPDNKIVVFGMSWGSILILKALDSVGAIIDGVITYGQFLHDVPFNSEVYSALENSEMSMKKKELLNQIKEEHSIENARLLMSWIRKYTSGYTGESVEKESMGSVIKGYFTSPDYKLRDCKAMFINGYLKNKSLMEELMTVDLRTELLSVSVPYTIIQGSLDIVTPTRYIREFLADNENENVKLVIVDKNGHIPNQRGMQAVVDAITLTRASS